MREKRINDGAGYVAISDRNYVQITNKELETELIFTATGIPFGQSREVILESFNKLSSVQSALKTERVRIDNVSTLGFAEELPHVVDIIDGQYITIKLPKIVKQQGFSSVDLSVKAQYDENIFKVNYEFLVQTDEIDLTASYKSPMSKQPEEKFVM